MRRHCATVPGVALVLGTAGLLAALVAGFTPQHLRAAATVANYSFHPIPLAAPGQLAAGASVAITVTAQDASSLPVPNAATFLSFTPAPGGGSAKVGTTPLTSAFQMFTANAAGQVAVTYTAPSPLPVTGNDLIEAQDAATNPTTESDDGYSFGTPVAYSFAPSPIAQAASLGPGVSQDVDLFVLDSSGNPIVGAKVFLSFTPTAGGGSVSVRSTSLSSTPTAFFTDPTNGHVHATYTTPSVLPTSGSDQLFAGNTASGPTLTAADSYSYAATPATVFDFAEGFTGPGFHEFLTVENPDATRTATLSFTYFESSGAVHLASPTCASVAPQRRCTENVNADVGANQQVSAEVRSLPNGGPAVPVIVERPMYFSHDFGFGTVNGGHDAVGATTGSTQRFFAEGFTGSGFQEYLTIENPNSVPLDLDFTYLVSSKTVTPQNPACETIARFSRCTENVNLDVGPGHPVSAVIASTNGLPFFAERPMYFKHDFGFGLIDGGHDGIGTSHVTSSADFAEGFTGPGFQEYLTIENPNQVAITLSFGYAGSSGPIGRHITDCATVAAHSRCTVNVNADAGTNQEVSAHISSSGGGFVVERPMYFNHDFGFGAVNGGHDGLGVDATTNMIQDFAEGFTASGFQEYLTVENPNGTVLQLDIKYYGAGGTINRLTPTACASVAAHSRCTVNVNADINANASSGQAVSAHLDSLNGVTFLAERPMYFAHTFGSDSVNGGHVSAGYSTALS